MNRAYLQRVRSDLRLLYRYIHPYRWAFLGLIAVMFVVGLTTALLNYLIKWIIDDLIIALRLELIPLFLVVVAAVYGTRAGLMYLSMYWSRWIGARAVDGVRRAVFDHVVRQPMRYFQVYPPGQLSARIVHDAEVLEQGMTHALTDLFMESFKALAVVGYVISLNWKMALFSLGVLPTMLFPIVYFGRRLRGATDRWHQALAGMSQYLQNIVRGIWTVQAYRGEDRESEQFGTYSSATLDARHEVIRWQALHSPLVEVFIGIGLIALIVFGAYEIRAGRLTPGGFTAFISGLFLVYTPVRKLSRANALLQETGTAAERLEALRRQQFRIPEPERPVSCPRLQEGIRFRDVWFSYVPGRPVLQGVNLFIPRGQIVALMGPSGVGKSTLVRLLPRFFDVDRGEILFDDVNIRRIRLPDLRRQIGWVAQQTFIFPDTVARNIAYGRPDATRAEIEEAARWAQAHDFIVALPDGYETRLGEGGVQLSGGQMQRVALARALLMRPQLLILDEAMSALDSESEIRIQDALQNLKERCTILVIAHRWSTLRLADRIAVMYGGRIMAVGKHEELVETCDFYRRMWSIQVADRVPTALAGSEPVRGRWS